MQLEGHADATWGDRNLYGLLLTYAGGAVLHQTKKISLIVDSTMEAEAIASAKCAESISYAREILRALGELRDQPTLITTDNLANFKVASGAANPTRSRHFLRRYNKLKERIAEGEVQMVFVNDEQQPADFLTKFLRAAKLNISLRYATNAGARDATRAVPASSSAILPGVGSGGLLESCPATWHASPHEALLPCYRSIVSAPHGVGPGT